MICSVCGNEYAEGSVCPVCGQAATPVREDPGKNMGLASLILGIAALVTCFIGGGGAVLPLGCSIAGLICGSKGGKDSAAAGFENKNAKIGKILSIVALVLTILAVIALVVFFVIYFVFIVGVGMLPVVFEM